MQGMFVIPPPPGEIQMYYMNMMMMRKKKEEALKRILSSKELNEPHIETNGEMMKYLLDTEIAQNFIHEFHDNHTIRPESLLNIAQRLKDYATEIKNRKTELIDEFMERMFPSLLKEKWWYNEINFVATTKLCIRIEPYPKGNFIQKGLMGAKVTEFLKTSEGEAGPIERLAGLIDVGDVIVRINKVAGDYETLYKQLVSLLKDLEDGKKVHMEAR